MRSVSPPGPAIPARFARAEPWSTEYDRLYRATAPVEFNYRKEWAAGIDGIVLADTKAGADSEEGRVARDAMIAKVRAEGVAAIADAMLPKLLGATTQQEQPDLIDAVRAASARGQDFRAIIPCGPSCWYRPFTSLVNREKVSLKRFVVFHMDECLDWQGRELPRAHPYSFRGFMEREFYGPVDPALAVPEANRWWPRADNVEAIAEEGAAAPVQLTYGGWGQDGWR